MSPAPTLGPEARQALAEDLCRIFLGWKLREDYEALLAIGEGSLHIDLRRGEAWCDGEPLPPLFIASELRAELERALPPGGRNRLSEATLDAEFHRGTRWHGLVEEPYLERACRVSLRVDGRAVVAQASNQRAGAPTRG